MKILITGGAGCIAQTFTLGLPVLRTIFSLRSEWSAKKTK